ncbi:MAG: hypothetical protein V1736_04710 [Pseudomonadota bacterium]
MRLIVLVLLITAALVAGCQDTAERDLPVKPPPGNSIQPVQVKRTEAVPKRPDKDPKLRIRLKRDAKGNYSWEITGADLNQIIQSERVLRKKFGTIPEPATR